MVDPAAIRARYEALSPHLDERGRRVFAASEARTAGYGGIAAVSRATGIAASTIGRGLDELADTVGLDASRVRRPGGGRKPLVLTDASLMEDLLSLVSPGERGDPMSPLRWTCKQLAFPQARARGVAAAAVRGDCQMPGSWIPAREMIDLTLVSSVRLGNARQIAAAWQLSAGDHLTPDGPVSASHCRSRSPNRPAPLTASLLGQRQNPAAPASGAFVNGCCVGSGWLLPMETARFRRLS